MTQTSFFFSHDPCDKQIISFLILDFYLQESDFDKIPDIVCGL